MSNFELNHYPRKYGKTHILVNNMFNYIYKTNAYKRILIYVDTEEQVEYLSDVITCNLDYQYEKTRRYKRKTNNKFVNKKDKYVIIVGTYEYHGMNKKKDFSINLVLFDELLKENSYEQMKRIINKYPKAEFKAYYTSKHCSVFGAFEKEIFEKLILEDFSNDTVSSLMRDYCYERVVKETERLTDTMYNLENVKFIFNEKVVLDNFIKKAKELNKKDLTTRSIIENVLFSSIKSMQVKYFGIMLINKEREDKINELYDIFKEKIESFKV